MRSSSLLRRELVLPPLLLLLALPACTSLRLESVVGIQINPEDAWPQLAGFWNRLDGDQGGGQRFLHYSPSGDFVEAVEGSQSRDYQLELFRQDDGRWLIQKRFSGGYYGGILLMHSGDSRPAKPRAPRGPVGEGDDWRATGLLPPRDGWHEHRRGPRPDRRSVTLDFRVVAATGRTYVFNEVTSDWELEPEDEEREEPGEVPYYDLWSARPQLSAQAHGLDVDQSSRLAKQFAESGIVSVPGFLDARTAQEMETARESDDFRALWTTSFDEDGIFFVSRADPVRHADAVRRAYEARAVGNYSYIFDRAVFEVSGCFETDPTALAKDGDKRVFDLCLAELHQRYGKDHAGLRAHASIKEVLESPSMRLLLERITGRRMKVATWFFSRFTEGQFLTYHSDSVDTRKIAFTIQLTDGWRATYGGLLTFLDDKSWDRRVERVLVPSFNTLTIFDVSQGEFPGGFNVTLPHMVTDVVQGVQHERVAVAGWYTFDDDGGDGDKDSSFDWQAYE